MSEMFSWQLWMSASDLLRLVHPRFSVYYRRGPLSTYNSTTYVLVLDGPLVRLGSDHGWVRLFFLDQNRGPSVIYVL